MPDELSPEKTPSVWSKLNNAIEMANIALSKICDIQDAIYDPAKSAGSCAEPAQATWLRPSIETLAKELQKKTDLIINWLSRIQEHL